MELYSDVKEIAKQTILDMGKGLPDIDVAAIDKWLRLNELISTYDELYNLLPWGWTKYNTNGDVLKPLHILMEKFDFGFHRVRIKYSNLFISVDHPELMMRSILNRGLKTCRNYSIKHCMVCGQEFRRDCRRKQVFWWPALCKIHYFQYINLKEL